MNQSATGANAVVDITIRRWSTPQERERLITTMVEKGYPAVSASTWAGLFLPKGTPAELAAKLHALRLSAEAFERMFERDKNELRELGIPREVLGNTKSGDGCSSKCAVEAGYSCDTYGEPCTPSTTTTVVCGNGRLAPR